MAVPHTECRQYEDAKYETYWSGGLNDKPVMQRVPRCTMSTIPFVVGGEVANPNEFPHMVNSSPSKPNQTKTPHFHGQIHNHLIFSLSRG